MKLGWRRGCVGGGLSFIASFPLRPPFPVQTYAVVTRLALAFTVVTFWSFFSTLDLAVLTGPAAIATALLGLRASWLLRSRHGNVQLEMETDLRLLVIAALGFKLGLVKDPGWIDHGGRVIFLVG